MPLFLMDNSHIDFQFAVWKITENLSFFLDKLDFDNFDNSKISSFYPSRFKEWVVPRFLLYSLLKENDFYCETDDFGKPFLKDSDINISFSHDKKWATSIISKKEIGIDIQRTSEKLFSIKDRIFSQSDLNTCTNQDDINCLLKLWTIKEAVYKAYGKKELDYKNDIIIRGKDIVSVINKDKLTYNYNYISYFYDDFCISVVFNQ
ncbi:MAG: 4'-phosphopantetheinyl transferase superfamily protein [Saprospiraceae bacterium]